MLSRNKLFFVWLIVGLGSLGGVVAQGQDQPSVHSPFTWTKIAEEIALRLNDREPVDVAGSLLDVAEQLTQSLAISVYVDDKALGQVGVSAEKIIIQYEAAELPLRSHLQRMLRPHH